MPFGRIRILKDPLAPLCFGTTGLCFSSGLCYYFIFFFTNSRTFDIEADPPSSTKASNIKILKASSGVFNFFLSKVQK